MQQSEQQQKQQPEQQSLQQQEHQQEQQRCPHLVDQALVGLAHRVAERHVRHGEQRHQGVRRGVLLVITFKRRPVLGAVAPVTRLLRARGVRDESVLKLRVNRGRDRTQI